MKLTSTDIQTAVYDDLRSSALAAALTGRVYRAGLRPRSSTKEDATVAFTAGTSGRYERGVVTALVFVADIQAGPDGSWYPDTARIAELETLAATWEASLECSLPDWMFGLNAPIHAEQQEETHEHFISIRIDYSHFAQ